MGCGESKEPQPKISWTAKDVVDKQGVIRTTDHLALLPVTSNGIKDKVTAASNAELSETKHVHELGMFNIIGNPLEKEVFVYHNFSAFRTYPDNESLFEGEFPVEDDKASVGENESICSIYDDTPMLQDYGLVTLNMSVEDVSDDVSTHNQGIRTRIGFALLAFKWK